MHWLPMILWTGVWLSGWIAGPFLAAGTLRWHVCWAYFAVLFVAVALHQTYVARRNPGLRQRRKRIGQGTPIWDMAWNLLFWPLMVVVPVVAGFGVRFAWAAMPAALFGVGVLLLSFGLALSAWAMASNPHFEGTVRIQADVGHRVVDTGPYRTVRHPGYLGLSLWALATPFLLLSWQALLPSGVVVAWIVLRTVLEDALLRRELAGYEDYSRRTRFRLVPGLW